MNKWEKEALEAYEGGEAEVLKKIEKQYKRALADIDRNIMILKSDELTQSRIYRIEHQKALRQQVSAILDKLHSDEYTTISQFLSGCYTDGFVGAMYNLHGQGIPLLLPIDPKQAVRAVLTDSKLSKGLYKELGVDIKKLKRQISAEISRGISSGMSYNEIARNISWTTNAPMSRARTIVRTEAHRITQASHYDAATQVKKKGVDIVLQWDASLDGDTRDTHRMLDGTIIEVGEYFESSGNKARYPGDFGDPAEDCNCRCVVTERARSALDEEELKTLQERAEFFGLNKTENLEDFRKKYLNAVANQDFSLEKIGNNGIISIEASALPDRFKRFVPEENRRREIIANGIDLPKPIFDDKVLGRLAKRIPPLEGYYDVVLHGTAYSFEFFGEVIDVETLCAIIAQRKDYKKGTNIRLIACNSGSVADGVAQYIADKLHITVLAPNKKAVVERLVSGQTIVYSGSGIDIHDGDFIPFVFKDKDG